MSPRHSAFPGDASGSMGYDMRGMGGGGGGYGPPLPPMPPHGGHHATPGGGMGPGATHGSWGLPPGVDTAPHGAHPGVPPQMPPGMYGAPSHGMMMYGTPAPGYPGPPHYPGGGVMGVGVPLGVPLAMGMGVGVPRGGHGGHGMHGGPQTATSPPQHRSSHYGGGGGGHRGYH